MLVKQNQRYFSKVYKNFINGKWVESKAKSHMDIVCPLT